MISYIKSELIKLKHSLGIWSTLLFALVVVIMEILIFKSKSNITLEIRENIHISLMLIVLMLNTLILTNQAFKSEKEAGNFQNMLTFKNCYRLWFSKLFSLFEVEAVIFSFAHMVGGLCVGYFNEISLLSIAIHLVIAISIHMVIQVKFGDIINAIVGVVEIILIVFSTNVPMKNWYYFLCCYGYKIYEYSDEMKPWQWALAAVAVFGSILLALLFSPMRALKGGEK